MATYKKIRQEQQNCINVRKHTKCPDGYTAQAEWAEEMLKTHDQIKCKYCGYLVIWVKKPAPNS